MDADRKRAALHDLKKDELKQMCQALGLPKSGTKAVLVGRLLGDAGPRPARKASKRPRAAPPGADASATQRAEPALVQLAREAGVLDGRGALIVSPMAAARSSVGRQVIARASSRRPRRPCVYLVPLRARAWEVFEALRAELAAVEPAVRLRVATGGAIDPAEPSQADVLVATYDAFNGLLLDGGIEPAAAVVDEIHLLADELQGPPLEMLLTYLRSAPELQLCGLSAVLADPTPIAGWLGVEWVDGRTSTDEPAVRVRSRMPDNFEWVMQLVLRETVRAGEVTRDHLREVLEGTLWNAQKPGSIDLDRPLAILCRWGFVETTDAGFRASPGGRAAARAGVGLVGARVAVRRIEEAPDDGDPRSVALWTLQDSSAEPEDENRWRSALEKWLDEVPIERIDLPTRELSEFESRMTDLAKVAGLYASLARTLGKPELARAAATARACLRHGVRPDALALAGLNIPELSRGRCRYLLQRHGIRTVADLARATPSSLAEPGYVALATCQAWVHRAHAIEAARDSIGSVPEPARRAEMDALTTELRVEAPSLEAT